MADLSLAEKRALLSASRWAIHRRGPDWLDDFMIEAKCGRNWRTVLHRAIRKLGREVRCG